MAKKTTFNTKKNSVKIVLWGILAMSVANALGYFNIYAMPNLIFFILGTFSSLFLLSEVDFYKNIKTSRGRKRLSGFDWVISTFALVGGLSSIISFIGITGTFLSITQGIVSLIITVLVIVELFRRNN